MNAPTLGPLEKHCADVGRLISEAMDSWQKKNPEQPAAGFALLMFTFGRGGWMTYVSNAERQNIADAFQEFLSKLGGTSGVVNGAAMVLAERERQVADLGFTPQHDAEEHANGDLARAGACYAEAARYQVLGEPLNKLDDVPVRWPFEAEAWDPAADPVRNMVKATALLLAELDRLLALREGGPAHG